MKVEFPKKLGFLFRPAPYKIAYGGRDGTKSWGFATALLELGAAKPLRILCARETQKSIADSVHKLLGDTIGRLNFGLKYRILESKIVGTNGTEIIFAGLKHNIDNIKSLEGADIVWVEEAQTVSKASWEKLLPTIRKEGAEVWVSFNPNLATDDTYVRWVLQPPPGAVVQKIGWEDNRWISEISKTRIEHMQAMDPVAFDHIYGGEPISAVEGAVFGAEMKAAQAEGRIGDIPYNRGRKVDTIWDLGFGDLTAVWFVQAYDGWYNFIDYLEGEGQTISDYLVQLQAKGYLYGTDWLPHDGVDTIIHHRLAGMGDRSMSIEMLMRDAGREVRICPKMYIADGINAARTVFPQCRFNSETCAQGLMALRLYQWAPPSALGVAKREPLHNRWSHGADAFRGAAIAVRQPEAEKEAARPKARRVQEYAPFG